MRIRLAVVSLMFVAVSSPLLRGQSTASAPDKESRLSRTEVSAVYNYVRSTITPQPTGQATGFSLSGVSGTVAYRLRPHLSLVLDGGGFHVNGVGQTGKSLTELPYLFGARYGIHHLSFVQPFAQVLLGGVHAYGGIYPPTAATTGGADAFAMAGGVGADLPLNPHISIRTQADYLYTGLPNAGSNRQNNLRIGAGIVAHFGVK